MKNVRSLTATATGTALLALAGIHAYWGLGGTWPGHDFRSLGRKVFASEGEQLPPPAACFAVAGGLTLSAAATMLVGRPGPYQMTSQGICQATAAALFLRGGLGFTLPRYTQANPEFREPNRKVYSPLCLVLGVGLLLSRTARNSDGCLT